MSCDDSLFLHLFVHVCLGRLVQSVFGHRDLVTCVAYSPDTVAGNRAVVVSGSRDSTVLVWYWSSSLQRIVSTDQDHGGEV